MDYSIKKENFDKDKVMMIFGLIHSGNISEVVNRLRHNTLMYSILSYPEKNTIFHAILKLDSRLYDDKYKLNFFVQLDPDKLKQMARLKNIYGETPLHLAVSCQNFYVSEYILSVSKDCINEVNNQEQTCLHLYFKGHIIDQKEKVDFQTGKSYTDMCYTWNDTLEGDDNKKLVSEYMEDVEPYLDYMVIKNRLPRKIKNDLKAATRANILSSLDKSSDEISQLRHLLDFNQRETQKIVNDLIDYYKLDKKLPWHEEMSDNLKFIPGQGIMYKDVNIVNYVKTVGYNNYVAEHEKVYDDFEKYVDTVLDQYYQFTTEALKKNNLYFLILQVALVIFLAELFDTVIEFKDVLADDYTHIPIPDQLNTIIYDNPIFKYIWQSVLKYYCAVTGCTELQYVDQELYLYDVDKQSNVGQHSQDILYEYIQDPARIKNITLSNNIFELFNENKSGIYIYPEVPFIWQTNTYLPYHLIPESKDLDQAEISFQPVYTLLVNLQKKILSYSRDIKHAETCAKLIGLVLEGNQKIELDYKKFKDLILVDLLDRYWKTDSYQMIYSGDSSFRKDQEAKLPNTIINQTEKNTDDFINNMSLHNMNVIRTIYIKDLFNKKWPSAEMSLKILSSIGIKQSVLKNAVFISTLNYFDQEVSRYISQYLYSSVTNYIYKKYQENSKVAGSTSSLIVFLKPSPTILFYPYHDFVSIYQNKDQYQYEKYVMYNVNLLKLLLIKGSSLTIRDHNKCLPHFYAVYNGASYLFNIILSMKRFFDFKICDQENKACLDKINLQIVSLTDPDSFKDFLRQRLNARHLPEKIVKVFAFLNTELKNTTLIHEDQRYYWSDQDRGEWCTYIKKKDIAIDKDIYIDVLFFLDYYISALHKIDPNAITDPVVPIIVNMIKDYVLERGQSVDYYLDTLSSVSLFLGNELQKKVILQEKVHPVFKEIIIQILNIYRSVLFTFNHLSRMKKEHEHISNLILH
ncbi:putative ankyrin repeat protein [Namao virus]|nr:putative ankyrin repeat protein [Namao virus]